MIATMKILIATLFSAAATAACVSAGAAASPSDQDAGAEFALGSSAGANLTTVCGAGCSSQVYSPRQVAGTWTPTRSGSQAWLESSTTSGSGGVIEIPVGRDRRLVKVELAVSGYCPSIGIGPGASIQSTPFGTPGAFTTLGSNWDSGATTWHTVTISTTSELAAPSNDAIYTLNLSAMCAAVKVGQMRVTTDDGIDNVVGG